MRKAGRIGSTAVRICSKLSESIDELSFDVDFTAEVTVEVFTGAGGDGQGFSGLGVGEWGDFGEPRVLPFLYMGIRPDDWFSGALVVNDSGIETLAAADTSGTGRHRVRLTWDSAASAGATSPLHSTGDSLRKSHQDRASNDACNDRLRRSRE